MKLVSVKCPNCGSNLELNADSKQVFCSYCGTRILIDDEVQHHQMHYDNAEDAGYQFEKGRQRAQAEQRIQMRAEQMRAPQPVIINNYVQRKPKKKRVLLKLILVFLIIFAFVRLISRPDSDDSSSKSGKSAVQSSSSSKASNATTATSSTKKAADSNKSTTKASEETKKQTNETKDNASKEIYVQTTGKVNLREKIGTDTTILIVIPKGTKLKCVEKQTTAGGYVWYKTTYENKTGWFYGEYAKEISQ